MGWQDAPVVDSGQPAWAKAPVVGAPPPTPVGPPGEIPGTQFTATPRETPGLMDRLRRLNLKAVGEAVIDQALGAIGGTVGGLGGLAGGVAGALQQAREGRAQPEGGVERSVMEGAQRGAEAMKQSFYGLPLVGQPSQQGQEYSEAAGQALGEIAPAMIAGPGGVVGLARQAPRGAVGTGLRAATDAVAGSKTAEAARSAAGAVGDKVLPEMSPSTLARVKTATEAGVPVSPHQLSGNKFLKLLGETAENVPLAGGETLRRTRREAFSGGLARAIDPSTDAAVLDDATFKTLQDNAGSRIGEIAGRTDVPLESFGDLSELARRDTPDVQGVIATYAKDLARIAEENGGVVPGDVLRKLRTEAQAQERGARAGKGDLANALDRFTKRLDDALAQHAPEADMEALADARRQYAISKALEPLVAAYPTGDFPPARLKAIVTGTKDGKHRMATGRAGELGDYARLGQEVLRDQVSSMTAERNLVYHTLGAVGAGGAVATVSPVAALAMYGSAGLYNLLGPRAVRWLAERQQRRNAPKPEGPPPEPTLGAGFEDVPQGQPPARPSLLGDLTPDWETAPGATPAGGPGEVVPAEGLVPAVDEARPMRVQPAGAAPEAEGAALRGAGEQIPAVPGRPDLPDTMVAGAPAEVGATEATGAAMQAPEAALARRQQIAEVERVRSQVADSPEVQKVLDAHAAKLQREAERESSVAALRKAAGLTTDPKLRQLLFDRAKKLEGAEEVPKAQVKEGMPEEKPAKVEKIPAGEATEVPTEEVVAPNPDLVFETGKGWVKRSIPAGEATELTPETVVYDAKGRALEVGRTYRDSKGRRAVWQADGTWKILR